MGTSPTGVSILFHLVVDICDLFLFVDLRDPEICWGLAQIEVMQQITTMNHVMTNVDDASKE